MRIVTNEGLIKRNARIGQIASLAGLVILIGGVFLSFQNQEQLGLSLGALLLGFTLSQVGIYFGNRYARPPRTDTVLDQALKGMDKRHTIYHYSSPVSHLLIGPSGIWALFPRHQRGTITYEKGRWRQKGGLLLTYFKVFAQEGIGRPDLEIGAELDALTDFLKKESPDVEFPPPQTALIFTNPQANIVEVDNAPVATLPVKSLKDYIRKQAKNKEARLAPEQWKTLQRILEGKAEDHEDEVE